MNPIVAPTRRLRFVALALAAVCAATTAEPARAQAVPERAASSSLLARVLADRPPATLGGPHVPDDGAGRWSMLHVPEPGPRHFAKHDLVQVIVRETSTARSEHELDTDKSYEIDGAINAWPELNLSDLLNLQLMAGRTANLPRVDAEFGKRFSGEGEYERRDDLTARLTAEIIEVLPNGNLVLEARTHIKNDEEQATMRMTGICRSQDVSPSNTVLSSQVYNLKFEKTHEGELKKANQKGLIPKVLDFFFAW